MSGIDDILESNHFQNYRVITPGNFEKSDLPQAWQQIIAASTIEQKRTILAALWLPFADKLPKTLALINQLEDALVINEGNEYKLVYIFKVVDALSAHVGHLPVQTGPFLDYLPADVAVFYKTIHNGWYENTSGGLGFLSLQDIEWLSEYEWGILDDLPPLDFDLSKTFYVFHNAGGGYLCFNRTDSNATECLVFWTTKEPKRHLDFWSFIDSWIEIGLTY